ncbi:MAG TPA: FHA domain-containing protein [Nocardioides sp.]|nr:FHA domain-containing protein [Nocardioides sp.]
MSSRNRCPAGHESSSDDYCDVCGLPIPTGGAAGVPAGSPAADAPDASGGGAAAGDAAAGAAECPNCQASNPPDALFCEACGYDFTTGSMPRPLSPPTLTPPAGDEGDAVTGQATPAAPLTQSPAPAPPLAPPLAEPWVAEVWIDPDWYAEQESDDPLPSAGVPAVVRLTATSVLVGRTSRSRGIHPDIDLTSDNGISRRHCQLTTDGQRWWVEDLGSSNGTYVGSAVGPLPKEPIDAGQKREIGVDDRIYLGAWTRIVIRKATPGEV